MQIGCASIPSGYAAVVMSPSGNKWALSEGLHAVPPLAQIDVYDLRAQEQVEDLEGVCADGGAIIARASLVSYRVPDGELVALNEETGPHYYDTLVRPVVRSAVRRVFARYPTRSLLTTEGAKAQAEITAVARETLRSLHIALDLVELRGIEAMLPLTNARTVDTGRWEQLALSEPTQTAIARAEGNRLREQARGNATANATVAPTLTKQTLSDNTAKAWTALLASPNTQIDVAPGTGRPLLEVSP
jgi:regulator of protease activity HflC (stomatin/prohibitin superfamily)